MAADHALLWNGPRAGEVIAVDVGNARIKIGRFAAGAAGGGSASVDRNHPLPWPKATLQLDGRRPALGRLARWLQREAVGPAAWLIASVNRPAATELLDWLHAHRGGEPVRLLCSDDLPLVVRGPRPDMVGVDRLLDAVAANALRPADRPAVVVDVGTAITVDLIGDDGAFRGGAILPGIGMSARALHEFTDLLPLLDMRELSEPPAPVGSSTEQAIRSGLFWMAVGTARELAGRMADQQPAAAEIFISGGAGAAVASLLGRQARHVPHLTLGGIALAGGVGDS